MAKSKVSNVVSKLSVLRSLATPEVIGALVVAVTIIAVMINTTDVILKNYKLEREVKVAEQKVAIAQLEVDSQRLQNQYYQTDAYLEIAARKQQSKGLPGERLVIVPKAVALEYVDEPKADEIVDEPQEELSNFQKWQRFLTGDLDQLTD